MRHHNLFSAHHAPIDSRDRQTRAGKLGADEEREWITIRRREPCLSFWYVMDLSWYSLKLNARTQAGSLLMNLAFFCCSLIPFINSFYLIPSSIWISTRYLLLPNRTIWTVSSINSNVHVVFLQIQRFYHPIFEAHNFKQNSYRLF